MVERKRLSEKKGGGSYFAAPASGVQFFSSGCTLIDCVLGGGWAVGRVANVVGDRSTGKTLLAIEACANFARTFDTGRIRYAEVEGAFDKPYAEALGLPLDRIEFAETEDGSTIFTVEDWFEDLNAWAQELTEDQHGLYILDSFDALSDRAELKRDIDEATYGGNKAKQSGQVFRRVVQLLNQKQITLFIISQTRDKIGVTFGEKHSRSGGRALDFYASQALWLAQITKFKKTIKGVERPIGVKIKAKCKKNKVGLPFRECEFDLMFGYGVDDVSTNVAWLQSIKRLDVLGLDSDKAVKAYFKDVSERDSAKERAQIADKVKGIWYDIEKDFIPTKRKYG